MCQVDWGLVAQMLIGIGTFMLGSAALLTLKFQFGYKAKSTHLKASLKLLLRSYKEFLASEEGILLSEYPKDAEKIIKGISRKSGLDEKLVKELLDELRKDNKI